MGPSIFRIILLSGILPLSALRITLRNYNIRMYGKEHGKSTNGTDSFTGPTSAVRSILRGLVGVSVGEFWGNSVRVTHNTPLASSFEKW